MKFLDRFMVDKKLVRHVTYRQNDRGHSVRWKAWSPMQIPQAEVVFLGHRTLSNGPTYWDSDAGYIYDAKEHIKVALVIPVDGKRNPFYIKIKD